MRPFDVPTPARRVHPAWSLLLVILCLGAGLGLCEAARWTVGYLLGNGLD